MNYNKQQAASQANNKKRCAENAKKGIFIVFLPRELFIIIFLPVSWKKFADFYISTPTMTSLVHRIRFLYRESVGQSPSSHFHPQPRTHTHMCPTALYKAGRVRVGDGKKSPLPFKVVWVCIFSCTSTLIFSGVSVCGKNREKFPKRRKYKNARVWGWICGCVAVMMVVGLGVVFGRRQEATVRVLLGEREKALKTKDEFEC